MKRTLLLLMILAIGAAVAAERFPALHARVPWLPNVPGLTAAAGNPAEGADAEGVAKKRRRFAADGPIPVLAAGARYADVPVTADVLGTVQATNSVLVRSQVDGKLVEIDFKEGQDVRKGDVVARIDPATYKALYDSAVAKKGQGRGAAEQRPGRPRPLPEARRNPVRLAPAGRHPEGAGGAGRGAARPGPGRHRQRQGDARLCHHPLADRRPHRHPRDRRGQPRPRQRHDRHRDHRPGEAHRGGVQPCPSSGCVRSTAPPPRGRCASKPTTARRTSCSTPARCRWWTTSWTRPPAR